MPVHPAVIPHLGTGVAEPAPRGAAPAGKAERRCAMATQPPLSKATRWSLASSSGYTLVLLSRIKNPTRSKRNASQITIGGTVTTVLHGVRQSRRGEPLPTNPDPSQRCAAGSLSPSSTAGYPVRGRREPSSRSASRLIPATLAARARRATSTVPLAVRAPVPYWQFDLSGNASHWLLALRPHPPQRVAHPLRLPRRDDDPPAVGRRCAHRGRPDRRR